MNRETEVVHGTLCSYSYHVCSRWFLKKKKGEKNKAGKVVGLHYRDFFLVIVLRNSVVIKHLGGEAVGRGIII